MGEGNQETPTFLHTFPMISLGVGEAEQPFLKKIVLLIPKAESNIEQPVGVRYSSDTILAPSIGA